ncbi:hypothetical protein GCM10009123_21170 [Kangiella japonica]|uniref:Uncharacterized protein n=1 Tax=Kangiella japonica TaxID=647384 RepID=A0ABP3CSL4_9GAMM
MQVQIKVYRNERLYDEFAFNTHDEKYKTETELVRAEFEAIDDPAGKVDKVVSLLVNVNEDNYTIAMLIPVHQSSEWEVSRISENYTLAVYCILGSGN